MPSKEKPQRVLTKVWCKSARNAAERSGGIRFAQDKFTCQVLHHRGDTFDKEGNVIRWAGESGPSAGTKKTVDKDGRIAYVFVKTERKAVAPVVTPRAESPFKRRMASKEAATFEVVRKGKRKA